LRSVAVAQIEKKRQIRGVEKQMDCLLYRIVDAASPTSIVAFEARLAKLERLKIILGEKVQTALPPKGLL